MTNGALAPTAGITRPTTLLAELTHRCPLHCPYCSNPLDLVRSREELSTSDWCRVVTEARALGVLQLGLSGGEPLVRRDLETIVAHATSEGLYSTLVTSGLGLTRERAQSLRAAGLDHIQVSLQDAELASNDRMAGTRSFERKLEAAQVARESGAAFTINVVLHRANLDRLDAIITLAASLGADRLELANTQYYGWALENRAALLPTRAQLDAAEPIVARARETYRGRMQVLYVLPDYYEAFPKPCMGGWGHVYIVVTPEGRAVPCQAATAITTLAFDNVRERPLAEIWYDGDAFNAFRGEQWMRDPCRTCEHRQRDFGGCRCQAFALTGEAANADPVCTLTPSRALIDAAIASARDASYHYRQPEPVGARARNATPPAEPDA